MMDAKYKSLSPELSRVTSQYISFSEQDEKKAKKLWTTVIQGSMLNEIKACNETFGKMIKRIYAAGSMYDKLRVVAPTEFDLDVVMRLPINHKLLELVPDQDMPGWVALRVPKKFAEPGNPQYVQYMEMRDMGILDPTGEYVIPGRLRSKMESYIAQVMNKLGENNPQNVLIQVDGIGTVLVTYAKQGPAFTFHLKAPGGFEIDVDLVLVLEFLSDQCPEFIRKEGMVSSFDAKEWDFFIVPKPMNKDPESQYWRISFQVAERKVLENCATLKQTAKLLKCLRDKQNWSVICSYHIKTMVMWLREQLDDSFWKSETNIGPLFIYAMGILRDRLKEGHMPYFWYPNHNLWGDQKRETLQNIAGRLDKILNTIDQEPPSVTSFIVKKK